MIDPEAGGGVRLRVEVDDEDPVAPQGEAGARGSPRWWSWPRRPSGWRRRPGAPGRPRSAVPPGFSNPSELPVPPRCPSAVRAFLRTIAMPSDHSSAPGGTSAALAQEHRRHAGLADQRGRADARPPAARPGPDPTARAWTRPDIGSRRPPRRWTRRPQHRARAPARPPRGTRPAVCEARAAASDRDGSAIASGIPGRPAPEPTSTQGPGGSSSRSGRRRRESSICRSRSRAEVRSETRSSWGAQARRSSS